MIRIKAPDRHDVKSRCKRSNITKKAEMKPLPHSYEVALSGGPTGYATLSTDGVPIMSSAPPKDFDGPKGDLVILDLASDGNYVACRPSGTEPKIKFYMFTYTPPEQLASLDQAKRRLEERLHRMEADLRRFAGV